MDFQAEVDWALHETQDYIGETFSIEGRPLKGLLNFFALDPEAAITGHSVKRIAVLVASRDQFASPPVVHQSILIQRSTGLTFSVTAVEEDSGEYTLNLMEISPDSYQ